MSLPTHLYAVLSSENHNRRSEPVAVFYGPDADAQARERAATLARDFRQAYRVAEFVLLAGTTQTVEPPAAAVKPAGGDVAERNGYHRAKGGSVRGGRGCVQRDDDRLAGRQLPPLDTGGTGGVCPAKGPVVQRDDDRLEMRKAQ